MFLNNMYLMIDFLTNNKEDFINLHSYITGLEYDLTHDYFYSDVVNNYVKLYKDIENSNLELKNLYLLEIQRITKRLSKTKQEQIKELLNERG